MKLGFLVSHLGATQTAFRLIYNANQACLNRNDVDIVTFYENMIKPCYSTGFVTSNVVDAWNYHGNLISTNLSTVHKSLRFPGPKQKYFYVFDLEWIKIPRKRYEALAEVYQNPDLKILARSDEHAERIEEAWSRPVRAIVQDFDIDTLIKVISEDEDAARKNKRVLR